MIDASSRYADRMRTTVNLDDDVAAAVKKRRRTRGIGLSEAVNELARAGMTSQHLATTRERVQLDTRAMNLRVDVSNVADALDIAEQTPAR